MAFSPKQEHLMKVVEVEEEWRDMVDMEEEEKRDMVDMEEERMNTLFCHTGSPRSQECCLASFGC